jgi:hypothetical protein
MKKKKKEFELLLYGCNTNSFCDGGKGDPVLAKPILDNLVVKRVLIFIQALGILRLLSAYLNEGPSPEVCSLHGR